MTTTRYRIITSMDEEDFQSKVNGAIADGYALLGGVSSRGAQLLQAVTKEEGEPSDNAPSEPEPDKVTTATVSKASTKAKATTKVKTEKKEG